MESVCTFKLSPSNGNKTLSEWVFPLLCGSWNAKEVSFTFDLSLHDPTAVSYTHLDVYKRQCQLFPRLVMSYDSENVCQQKVLTTATA